VTPRTEQHGGHDEQGGCGEAEGASRDGDGELARGGGSDEVIVRDRRARAALHRSNLGALQRLFSLPDARLPSPNLQHDVACDVVRSSMPVEESLAVCDAAIAESDCVAGHIGLEPGNPSASYLIGFIDNSA
jgi:hypothetical protein